MGGRSGKTRKRPLKDPTDSGSRPLLQSPRDRDASSGTRQARPDQAPPTSDELKNELIYGSPERPPQPWPEDTLGLGTVPLVLDPSGQRQPGVKIISPQQQLGVLIVDQDQVAHYLHYTGRCPTQEEAKQVVVNWLRSSGARDDLSRWIEGHLAPRTPSRPRVRLTDQDVARVCRKWQRPVLQMRKLIDYEVRHGRGGSVWETLQLRYSSHEHPEHEGDFNPSIHTGNLLFRAADENGRRWRIPDFPTEPSDRVFVDYLPATRSMWLDLVAVDLGMSPDWVRKEIPKIQKRSPELALDLVLSCVNWRTCQTGVWDARLASSIRTGWRPDCRP